jgi:hypothetical protein
MDCRRLLISGCRFVLHVDIHACYPLPETMGTETVSCEEFPGDAIASLTRLLALFESSSWYPSTLLSPGCPTNITNTAFTLKCCATAMRLLRLPLFSLFSVITLPKTCTNKRSISERLSHGPGCGRYHGYRNVAAGRMVSGGRHEAA